MAEWTGLEPATPGVTGRYSNQLNYHSAITSNYVNKILIFSALNNDKIKALPNCGADNTVTALRSQLVFENNVFLVGFSSKAKLLVLQTEQTFSELPESVYLLRIQNKL